MPRVTNAVARKKRHKKVLKQAKGYFGARHRLYRVAKNAIDKANLYNYRDRRQRRRNFRVLWITRINAASRQYGLSYSAFMAKLKQKDIQINRKLLSDLAVNYPDTFSAIVKQVEK